MKSKYVTDYELSELVQNANSKLTNSNEYVLICPVCREYKGSGYNKSKLYVNKDMTVGHCFVCESVFLNKSGRKDIVLDLESKINIKEPSTFPTIKFYGEDQYNPESKQYLVDRCPALYENFDFHSNGFYTIDDKIVIKFLKDSNDYFYQIRFTNPNAEQRYYTPPIPNNEGKPFYIALGEFKPFNSTVFVEGVFTALTEKLILGKDYNVLALLGHSVTDYQINLLQNMGQMGNIYIHMDTYQYSCNVREKLKRKFPDIKIISNYSEKLDSEELIRNGKITIEKYREFLLKSINKDNDFWNLD